MADNGLVLLYHYVSAHAPEGLGRMLHTTHPSLLARHLKELGREREFVPLSTLLAADNRAGLAAVTFDDGYWCVLDEALPVLESFNIPATVFLNPAVVSGYWNWRDKIRYVVGHGFAQDFLAVFPTGGTAERLYRDSKHPSVSSAAVDRALDGFLGETVPDVYGGWPYAEWSELPVDHPLLTYGNHGYRHYVLSSLSPAGQRAEVFQAGHELAAAGLPLVEDVLAVPFGGNGDLNRETIRVAATAGYRYLLMSRQHLDTQPAGRRPARLVDRVMPKTTDIRRELEILRRTAPAPCARDRPGPGV